MSDWDGGKGNSGGESAFGAGHTSRAVWERLCGKGSRKLSEKLWIWGFTVLFSDRVVEHFKDGGVRTNMTTGQRRGSY